MSFKMAKLHKTWILCLMGLVVMFSPAEAEYPDDVDYDEDEVPANVSITSEPQTFEMRPGQVLRLPCKGVNLHLVAVMWKKDDDVLTVGEIVITDDKRFKLSMQDLIIENITAKDLGEYKCKTTNVGAVVEVIHTLTICEHPSISVRSPSRVVKVGKLVTLACKVTGCRKFNVTWERQGKEMPSGETRNQGSELTFARVTRHYSGIYKCVANNYLGSASTAIILIVMHAPEIEVEKELVSSVQRLDADLVCTVYAEPKADVQWLKNGVPVDANKHATESIQRHYWILHLKNVQESDFGNYTCVASNELGTSTKDVSLTVAISQPKLKGEYIGKHELPRNEKLVVGYKNVIYLSNVGIVGRELQETITLSSSISINLIVYNPVTDVFIIHDVVTKHILQYDINNKTLLVLVREGLDSVTGIDIDILSQNLYWVDRGTRTIEVLSLTSGNKIVLKQNFQDGQDILIDSTLKKLYVAQNRKRLGIIWRMNLDAGQHESYASYENKKLRLTLDTKTGIIYWNERSRDLTLTSGSSNFADDYSCIHIAVFNSSIYCSQTRSKNVLNIRRGHRLPGGFQAISSDPDTSLRLAILNPDTSYLSEQLSNNECSGIGNQSLRCSHICIRVDDPYSGSCICPTEMVLDNDNVTCINCSLESHSKSARCLDEASLSGETKSLDSNSKTSDANKRKIEKTELFLNNAELMVTLVVALTIALFIVASIIFALRLQRNKCLISEIEIREFRHGKELGQNKISESYIYGKPYEKNKFEVNKHEFVKERSTSIGGGNFGLVYKSFMSRFNCEVAVKSPKTGNPEEVRTVLCEIKVLSYVGEHPNIVKLLGAYTKELRQGIVLVIMELCCNGSLLNHLKTIQTTVTDDELIVKLFRFCKDIALGMEYLSEKNVIHGDLSARNVLLDENFKCKICDFGLSRKIERYATYIKKTHEPLPWAWLAVESLSQLEFTLKSDVWSMGVTYWEIFTFGAIPYPGESCSFEFIQKLRNGLRLPKPELLSADEFDVILQCWTLDPCSRPQVSTLRKFFGNQNECVYLRLNP